MHVTCTLFNETNTRHLVGLAILFAQEGMFFKASHILESSGLALTMKV